MLERFHRRRETVGGWACFFFKVIKRGFCKKKEENVLFCIFSVPITMSRSRRCGAQHRVGGVSPFFYFEKSKLIEPVDQKAVFFNQGGIVGGMTVGNRDGGENPKKVDQHRHKYHIKSPR